MSAREIYSFCRFCSASCGMRLTVEQGRIIDVQGDEKHPATGGYSCYKGRSAADAHYTESRLLHPLKRMGDGSFQKIPLETALDEIAEKLKTVIETHGANSIGAYPGNSALYNSTAYPMVFDFMRALGSDHIYSPLTLDQPCKIVSAERLGVWTGGVQGIEQAEVVLLFGTNPIVSRSTPGLLASDPVRKLNSGKARGMKIICVDPRRSETASHADLFLQPVPGQDSAILAGLIRIILDNGWHDADFCRRWVPDHGMRNLRDAVAPFTEEVVEARAGLLPGQLMAVAEMFARDNKRGASFAATGLSMSPFPNLSQHLNDTLNVICGRLRRPGDRRPVDALTPLQPVCAEALSPTRSWEGVPPSRIRGVGRLGGERLASTLAEEITTQGEGQLRCLIVDGANPVSLIPDQTRLIQAFSQLDLLVSIEPYMTTTAQMSHYILPPKLPYERPDIPMLLPGFTGFPYSWSQYTPPVIEPPEGSDLADDWYVFWRLASRLDLTVMFDGKAALDMKVPPTTDDLIAIRLSSGRTSLEELKSYSNGLTYDDPSTILGEEPKAATGRFDVMPADVADELSRFAAIVPHTLEHGSDSTRFPYLLCCRRMRDLFNSNGLYISRLVDRYSFNPLFMNPEDLAREGISPGEMIEITSDTGIIRAHAQVDRELRPGVMSLSHGWGALGNADGDEPGVNVNRLIDSTQNVAEISAMPRMSSIPVRIQRLSLVEQAAGAG